MFHSTQLQAHFIEYELQKGSVGTPLYGVRELSHWLEQWFQSISQG